MEEKNSGSFDMKTLIHVGVEIVVVGAITFWFQKKCSSQQAEIEELREKVENLERAMEMQNKMLMEHRGLFQNLLQGHIPPSNSSSGYPSQSMMHPSQSRSRENGGGNSNSLDSRGGFSKVVHNPPRETERMRETRTSSVSKKSPPRKKEVEITDQEEEEIENEEENEEEEVNVDELLKEELQSITVSPLKSRGTSREISENQRFPDILKKPSNNSTESKKKLS
jgi:hypothetical protein